MNKLIKLSAVSMLAIVAATGANAAGYTCEELIQYTSCNPGYYLNNGDCIGLVTSCDAGYYLTGAQYSCPDGYVWIAGACDTGTIKGGYSSPEYCEGAAAGTWYGDGCLFQSLYDAYDVVDVVSGTTNTCPSGYAYATGICVVVPQYDWARLNTGVSEENCSGDYIASGCWKSTLDKYGDFVLGTLVGGTSCVAAPAGSYSPGGLVASATTCAAGTYQPQSAQASCITTPKGNYSIAGATSYTACPSTGLTDKDGNTVVATTLSTGATGVADCVVGSDVVFKDSAGLWHYKSSCEYSVPTIDEACAILKESNPSIDCSMSGDECLGGGSTLLYDSSTGLAKCVYNDGNGEMDLNLMKNFAKNFPMENCVRMEESI